jgi:transcriptional regulator with XRE-family HTH domain
MNATQVRPERRRGRPSLKASVNSDAIKILRERRGLSQEQLAERLGVAVGTISRYERGSVTPSRTRLKQIAASLGVRARKLERRPDPTDALSSDLMESSTSAAHRVSARTDVERWWRVERARLSSGRVDESLLKRLDDLVQNSLDVFENWFDERVARQEAAQKANWNYYVFPLPLVILLKLTNAAMSDRWR